MNPTTHADAPRQAAAATLRYDGVARLAHWLTVILIVAEYTVAWTMPDIRPGIKPDAAILLHLSLGISLLALIVFRILWRITHRPPPTQLIGLQAMAARATHLSLYVLLVIMPLTGWAAASVRSWPVRLFGFLTVPALLPPHTGIGFGLGDLHADVLSWLLLAVIALHVCAALYHGLVRRDGVVSRMWFSGTGTR